MTTPSPVPQIPAQITVDGRQVGFEPGQSVASVLLMHGIYRLRRSPAAGGPRGPFCMMGACQECAIHIDGALRQACLVQASAGMTVELKGVPGA